MKLCIQKKVRWVDCLPAALFADQEQQIKDLEVARKTGAIQLKECHESHWIAHNEQVLNKTDPITNRDFVLVWKGALDSAFTRKLEPCLEGCRNRTELNSLAVKEHVDESYKEAGNCLTTTADFLAINHVIVHDSSQSSDINYRQFPQQKSSCSSSRDLITPPRVEPPFTFQFTSSSSSPPIPPYFMINGHKTFLVHNLTLSTSTVLSAHDLDDYHFFWDLQDRIKNNLDVGKMMCYKPVIQNHLPFSSIKNKWECLVDIPLLVNYLPHSDSTWQNRLVQAVLYTLQSEYGLSHH
ncbi:hypothetical protein HMI56_007012 [Coelomomyces lativittatus]|nr:hypothetical protein HMI56_007012 [Coelomomyces lativittatus]